MVGYSKDRLIDFMSVMDSYSIEDVASKQKVIASFYKILSSDIDKVIVYKKEVFSELLMLLGAYYKKHVKYYSMTYAEIASNVVSHELNRALYNQSQMQKLFTREQEIHPFILTSMKDISDGNLAGALSKVMILTNTDLQDLLVDVGTQRRYLDRKLFIGDSFATIEEVIDGN